jgi:hypothetical protein
MTEPAPIRTRPRLGRSRWRLVRLIVVVLVLAAASAALCNKLQALGILK